MRRRERVLMLKSGNLYVQDDPYEHAIERVEAIVDGRERSFLYEVTYEERDESGEMIDVAWYAEE